MKKILLLLLLILIGCSKNGVYETYYDDSNQLYSVETYKNGQLDGPYQSFYDNGILKEDSNYKNGKLHGSYKLYYSNGIKQTIANYKNGKLDGVHKSYFEWGEHRENTYFENGEMISKKEYENSSSSGNSSPCSASASEVKRKALSHANANYYLAASFTGCRFETGQVKTNESGNTYYVSIYCGANNPIDYIYKCNNGSLELISVND